MQMFKVNCVCVYTFKSLVTDRQAQWKQANDKMTGARINWYFH